MAILIGAEHFREKDKPVSPSVSIPKPTVIENLLFLDTN